MGESSPIGSNSTFERRAMNRRVELSVNGKINTTESEPQLVTIFSDVSSNSFRTVLSKLGAVEDLAMIQELEYRYPKNF